MKKFLLTFLLLITIGFLAFLLVPDRVAAYRVEVLLDLLSEKNGFNLIKGINSDFHSYAITIHFLTLGLSSLLGSRFSCFIVNCFLTALAISLVREKIFNDEFDVLALKKISFYDGSLFFYYFSFNLSLLTFLSTSLRDSFLFSLNCIFLLAFSRLFQSKLCLKNLISSLLIISTILLIISYTRREVLMVILLTTILSTSNISIFQWLSNSITMIFNFKKGIEIKYIKKKFFLFFLTLFVSLSLILPLSHIYLNHLNDLANPNEVNYSQSIIEKISDYQMTRISRNDLTSFNNSDVADSDEYLDMSLYRRIFLQSINLLITPFPLRNINFYKILTLLDSLVGICLIFMFFKTRIRNPKFIFLTKNVNQFSLVSSNFALVSFASYSIFILNGGNAFRYKQHWLPFLMISITEILYRENQKAKSLIIKSPN